MEFKFFEKYGSVTNPNFSFESYLTGVSGEELRISIFFF
jgi:hypothetical protein